MLVDAMHTCCFLGHREIVETQALRLQLYNVLERLIIEQQIDCFLFGSKSQFIYLCYEIVTELKNYHPHIKRIYVRAEFPQIGEDYRRYLLSRYEDTYYPEKIIGAGRAVYIKRNAEMINKSRFCVFYYEDAYVPKERKSGTKIALDYAVKHKKEIIRVTL